VQRPRLSQPLVRRSNHKSIPQSSQRLIQHSAGKQTAQTQVTESVKVYLHAAVSIELDQVSLPSARLILFSLNLVVYNPSLQVSKITVDTSLTLSDSGLETSCQKMRSSMHGSDQTSMKEKLHIKASSMLGLIASPATSLFQFYCEEIASELTNS
jgi:hypothetical protein